MALTVMQLLIVSNGIKRKRKERAKEKRTSVQYSITQIDTDKAIGEALLFFSSSSSCVRIERMKLNLNRETQKEENECESLRLFYCLHILHQIIELMSRFFFCSTISSDVEEKKINIQK
jgi:hypothetical protein